MSNPVNSAYKSVPKIAVREICDAMLETNLCLETRKHLIEPIIEQTIGEAHTKLFDRIHRLQDVLRNHINEIPDARQVLEEPWG